MSCSTLVPALDILARSPKSSARVKLTGLGMRLIAPFMRVSPLDRNGCLYRPNSLSWSAPSLCLYLGNTSCRVMTRVELITTHHGVVVAMDIVVVGDLLQHRKINLGHTGQTLQWVSPSLVTMGWRS